MMVARRVRVCVVAALVAVVAGCAAGVKAVEEEECTSAYNYLAGCLTFVSGPDVIPNPVCCGGVNHLSTNDPHCLCTIIRELDDNPSVNFTKACALAYQCRAALDGSECPGLLMPAGYPLAPSLPPGYKSPLSGDDESAASASSIAPRAVALVVLFTALLSSTFL